MTDKKVQHFNVYGSVSAGTDDRGRPQFKKGVRLGVAWWHNDKHEGLNIILDGLPPSGRLVMFKHDPDWQPEDKATAKPMAKPLVKAKTKSKEMTKTA